ncbi:MAG: hypothetical protein JSS81_11270 [Acidobacteria bacterium]|nr:hypothetical protein [Acidobacteriota bacterium]
MKFGTYLTNAEVEGIFELTNEGKVLYSQFRQHNRMLAAGPELIGHNFFEEVVDFDNVGDFRQLVGRFVESRLTVDSFFFDCRYGEKTVPVRVMLLRAFENRYPNYPDIIILDIRNTVY